MDTAPKIKNLDSLLEKHFQKRIKVLKQETKCLTAPGENYGSIMVSLNVSIEDEQNNIDILNLVAKFIPTNELLKEMFQVQLTFIKELRFYRRIIPTLSEIEDEYSIVENRASDLFAKCFGGRSNLNEEEGFVDDDSVLLLENLKLLGYETGDRLIGFDYETAVFVLNKLATFHGTAIAAKYIKPEKYEINILDTLKPHHKLAEHDLDATMNFINGIGNIILVNTKFPEKVQIAVKNLTHKLTVNFYTFEDPHPFVTVVHADFWVNNMMIKRENGKPVKLMIVDFQTAQNQSVVYDLLFLIYSSFSPDIRYDKIDEFLKIYYDSFISCLKQFNIDLDKFSWDTFMLEIKNKAYDVLSQILMMYKPILLERGSIDNMNDVENDSFFRIDNVSEKCKFSMSKTFEQFAEKNWI